MSFKKPLILVIAILLLISCNLMAQNDKFGKVDTLYLETYQIDAKNWAVHISLFNDEEVMALSVPITFSSGKIKIVADSTSFKGGLVEAFRVKQARADTASQCLTLGLINDVGVSVPPIQPGKGRIATVFVSALEGVDLPTFVVDTTTTPPGNSLQLVKPPSVGILPALVIKQIEKVKKEKVEKKVTE